MQLSLVLSRSKQISVFIDLDGLCAGCLERRGVSDTNLIRTIPWIEVLDRSEEKREELNGEFLQKV